MKYLSVLLLALLAAWSARAQESPPTPKKDECSISGMVVKLAGSEPLRKARVTLQNAEEPSRSTSVVTDADGRFRFKGIEPGRYHLQVGRAGFVAQGYGQKRPDDPGALLTLRPGQEVKDLLFRLIPSAVIAGRILDEDGEPLPEVTVSALKQAYLEGKHSLATQTTVETNDLGEYRLFGLSPGRYFISAALSQWGRFTRTDESQVLQPDQQGHARMYYPGTPDASKATSISIRAGEEIPSIEMLMRLVRVYRIRGHVYNQITHKAETQTNIFLIPRTKSYEWAATQQAFVQKQDGAFEIADVLPGAYVLAALWFEEGKRRTVRVPVDVGNGDVEGIAITIAPGSDIDGRIVWDGPPTLEQDELSVMLQSGDMGFMFGFGGVRVTPANTFLLKDVGDGSYRANVMGQGKDCYIKDVQFAGSSALDEGFVVTRGSTGTLEITISSRGARVQGAVTDQDGLPAAGVLVVLVPHASRRAQSRPYKNQTTDQYGHFELRGIAPGSYKLFSWEEIEDGAWEDPEFLKPFEDKGETITLEEGQQKTVNITAIHTKKAEE